MRQWLSDLGFVLYGMSIAVVAIAVLCGGIALVWVLVWLAAGMP